MALPSNAKPKFKAFWTVRSLAKDIDVSERTPDELRRLPSPAPVAAEPGSQRIPDVKFLDLNEMNHGLAKQRETQIQSILDRPEPRQGY